MERNTISTSVNNSNNWDQFDDDNDDLLLVSEDVNLNTSSLRNDERYVGFDNNFGDTWIYPSNFPERAYQYNIVQKALFQNTLVVLPTGLGKTFIAAVVMYNMYRWYPMGKVVFMAPTKPLVAQQIDACCKIVGIPMEDSVEITGKLSKKKRAELWQTKRVFFATPQSVQSDIMDTELEFPFHAIKLVVVDEAHKAKGRYAYTDVISGIWRKNKYFRILALSATPGRRKDDVEEVIRNLFISSLEVRTEDSVDVVSYVHRRLLKTVVVELGEKLKAIRNELIAIADPHLRNLIDNHLISNRPGSISRNWLVMEQKRFREHLVNNQVPRQKELSSDFSICISIYHAMELLERHGTRVFLNNFDDSQEGGTKFVVKIKPDLRRLIEKIREETGQSPFVYSDQSMVNGGIASIPRNVDFGHPKFEIAREHILEHFQKNEDARCIIFCEYRESVMLMHRLLLQHRPLIRPKIFVGQGSNGSIRAVTQREQINIMNGFRSGDTNALIATSVAEEGIDVGEVDLIVCFDINTSNPTRFIQRIGRTGRKRQGKVLLLATEGKEHAVLKEVLSERNRLNKSISRGGEFASAFYKQAPRMVPTEFNPKCLKTFVQANAVDTKLKSTNTIQTKKKSQNPKNSQHRDLRHFFKPKVTLNEDEIEIFENVNESPFNSNNKSKTNGNFLADEEQTFIDFSPVKIPKLDSKAMQKMVKYIKTSTKEKTTDVQKVLMSNKLSKSSLQLLIDFSPDAVHDICSHMKTLWDKGVNEDFLPAKGFLPIDRKVVKSYNRLIDILGSKDKVAELMSNQRENRHNCSELFQKCGIILGDLSHKDKSLDNFDFLTEKLEKLSDLMISNNCREVSYAHSMVYDAEAENESLHHSMHNEDSRCEYSTEHIFDSKYMSQWDKPSYTAPSFQQTSNKQTKSGQKIVSNKNAESDNSDEDVMFVGVTQQSTPIRTGYAKQRLLNFERNQIVKPASNKSIASNKVLATENEKQPNMENDDLFDDQFDDIIAANSMILAHIESSDLYRKCVSESQQNIHKKISEKSLLSNHCIPTLNEPTANSVQHSNNTNFPPKTDSNPNERMDTKSVVLLNNSSTKYDYESSACKNKPTSNGNLNEVHLELADIDFSEEFSDETYNDLETNQCEENRRNSPDIFADLSQVSKGDLVDCKTPSKCVKVSSAEVSPCLLTKKALTWKEVRLKYGNSDSGIKSSFSKPNESVKEQNESVIKMPGKPRLKRRIIDTDSDTSETNFPISSHLEEDIPTSNKDIRKNVFKKPRLYRRGLNEFIDGEAVHSGSETEDEIEHTQGCYLLDSVVVHDDDVENDDVNMTGVYLQSVRSPCKSTIGRFKIPAHRQYNDASKIFSQKVCEDNNSYEQDSFIIGDEEDDVDQSLCPLERAEQILKNRRRIRRNAKRNNSNLIPKRKRVLRILNESDEDFE